MKNSSLRSSVFGAIFAATGVLSTLVADPLAPNGSVDAPYIGSLSSGTLVATNLSSFASPTVSGQVGVSVWAGVLTNPFAGGLTFIYEVMNLSVTGTEGLTSFGVDGWGSVNMDVVTGDGFYFSPSGSPVDEGFTTRSVDGNTVLFDFPPGTSEPPIYQGQNSYQLIVYTDATAWQVGTGSVVTWDFDGNGAMVDGTSWGDSMTTLVAVPPVPEFGSTLALMLLGMVPAALLRRRKGA